MQAHSFDERMDWLMANQLSKDKKNYNADGIMGKGFFFTAKTNLWCYQARLRWVGQAPPPNTEELLSAIEKQIENEEPEVQWAMIFTAGWMGAMIK